MDSKTAYGVEKRLEAMSEPERTKIIDSTQKGSNNSVPQRPEQAKNQMVKQPAFWPELITAKDLLEAPPDPTRWIWRDVLPAGSSSLVTAKPRVGKSTFCANLAIAVARGLPFLNRPTLKSGVVYLSFDASRDEIRDTFMSLGLRADDLIDLHIGAAPPKAQDWLLDRVKNCGARLVVVDTLQKIFHFQDINSYSEVVNVMDPLIEQARALNIHLLFVHHAKKDAAEDFDSGIGSTALRGMVYSLIHFKKLPKSERRILSSDQKNGNKGFDEVAIGFGKSGWL